MSPSSGACSARSQAVMSLLEGFGDYVMDEVGRDLVPDVERSARRFHARRGQRTGFERAMMRVTGMDLKMEQYRKGEEFVAAVARGRRRGGAAHALARPRDAAVARGDRSPSTLAGTGAAAP